MAEQPAQPTSLDRWCSEHPSPRGKGPREARRWGAGASRKLFLHCAISPPDRFAATLPSRGGMAPPMRQEVRQILNPLVGHVRVLVIAGLRVAADLGDPVHVDADELAVALHHLAGD